MFEPTSRYFSLKDMLFSSLAGRKYQYKERRFLPAITDRIETFQQVAFPSGYRLDLIAFRAFGDPEQFWRIADANNAMHPLEITERPGKSIRIPTPG